MLPIYYNVKGGSLFYGTLKNSIMAMFEKDIITFQ